MYVLIISSETLDTKLVFLYNTKEEAINAMLEDFRNQKREEVEEDSLVAGLSEDKLSAWLESDTMDIRWEVVKVSENE